MKFSIIIPAHNTENYIRKTLDSIKMQQNIDPSDYEVIVVCDCCIDKTEEIARSYEESMDIKVCVVNYHNDGPSRNEGLDIAKGDWIMFMDSDDWWIHEYTLDIVNRVIEFANSKEENPIDMLVFGFIWKGKGYCNPYFLNTDKKKVFYSNVWSKCFRRDFIGDTRFGNMFPYSDLQFCKDIMKKQPRSYILDMPLYYYNYYREGSIMTAIAKNESVELL